MHNTELFDRMQAASAANEGALKAQTASGGRVFHAFATAPKAMEPLLETELKELGASRVVPSRAGCFFEGSMPVLYRACLESRIANRILVPIRTFHAPNPEKLYGGVKAIRWRDHLRPNGTLAVEFVSSRSAITHTHFGAQKVKDAVCDQLLSIFGERPSVRLDQPDVRIHVYLLDDVATVSIDLSGQSLHLRGWREEGASAPLKENLASAMLRIAGWEEKSLKGGYFLDPMCGSGTLPIEAALMARGEPAGWRRDYFGFEGWIPHQDSTWRHVRTQADERMKEIARLRRGDEGASDRVRIFGSDRDPRALSVARDNAVRAGVDGDLRLTRAQWEQVQAPAKPEGVPGVLIVNPPYGERLGEEEELVPLYKSLGDGFKQRFKGWTAFVLTSNPELAKVIGLKAARRHVLFNGALECRLLQYELY